MPPTRGLLVPVGRKPEWYLTAESACVIKQREKLTKAENERGNKCLAYESGTKGNANQVLHPCRGDAR